MIRNYLLIAVKVLLRRKFFTFISLFGISFTLLVLMVATAFLDHIFGAHAPETKQDRMLGIYTIRLQSTDGSHTMTTPPGYKFLHEYVRPLPSAEKVSVFSEASQAATYRNGEEIKLYLKRTDGEFWEILDFQFIEGRPLTKDDEKNGNFVAVINQSSKETLFGNESALGKPVTVDGQTFHIIGVVKNVPILRITPFADMWVPISTFKSSSYKDAFNGGFMAAILAKDKKDLDLIRSDFQANLAKVQLPNPKEYNRIIAGADTFFESLSRQLLSSSMEETRSDLLTGILVFVMLLFMTLPTIDLVNINISRIMERASEIGVRKAFGASSWTLVGQFITENILLTLIGGFIGILLSFIVLQFINSSSLIPYAHLQLNHRIFMYGFILIIFFGFISGVYPAWKMSRLNPVDALKGGAQ